MSRPSYSYLQRQSHNIDIDGVTYRCERKISEYPERSEQEISVFLNNECIGSTLDLALYGPRFHPYDSMKRAAEVIAFEIVAEWKVRQRKNPL